MLKLASAFIGGVLVTLSLAPFNYSALAIIASGLLFAALHDCHTRDIFTRTFSFSLGLFLTGASWVYVSIHEFGYMPPPIAAGLTLLFCLFLATVNALLWTALSFTRNKSTSTLYSILVFSSVGTLTEFLRSWLFTGFPWLFAGYSQTQGLLSGWAPVIGVYGISFILYFSGGLLAQLFFLLFKNIKLTPMEDRPHPRHLAAISLLTLGFWMMGPALKTVQWTQAAGDAIKVALVQANISQHDKWRPEFLAPTLALYRSITEESWLTNELVVWPEAAIPQEYHHARPFLSTISDIAKNNNSALLTGIPYRDTETGAIHNSITALGNGSGLYHKQRLVPFGEYVPLATFLEPIINIFGLPMSAMSPGPDSQKALTINSWRTTPLICYEIVYPSLSARAAMQSDILVTVSNDSWFGASIGPLQHLQMAQMRALENGRYLIRGTGNGVSAIVAADGSIIDSTEQFTQTVLQGEVYQSRGYTPWTRFGHILFPGLIIVIFVVLTVRTRMFSPHTEP